MKALIDFVVGAVQSGVGEGMLMLLIWGGVYGWRRVKREQGMSARQRAEETRRPSSTLAGMGLLGVRIGWRVIASLAVILFVVAALWAAEWTLRFSRALAWPVFGLIALYVLRVPLANLVQGQVLKRVSVAGVAAELEQRDEQLDLDQLRALAAEAAPSVEEVATIQEQLDQRDFAVDMLATLAQIFQVQIDFLKYLQQAAAGLTIDAAEGWFRSALARNPVTQGWEIPPLLSWLVDRGLVELTQDGRYVVTDKGVTFTSIADSVWYAAKLV